MNRTYAQIREDNILWALKELRKNYVVWRDETFELQEKYPDIEHFQNSITKYDGAVEALDHAIAILRPGPK